jgi:hypothetical protein
MPEGVRKIFDEELNKLMGLEPVASEANVTRNYLEWLTQVHILPCFPVSYLTPALQITWGHHTPVLALRFSLNCAAASSGFDCFRGAILVQVNVDGGEKKGKNAMGLTGKFMS